MTYFSTECMDSFHFECGVDQSKISAKMMEENLDFHLLSVLKI